MCETCYNSGGFKNPGVVELMHPHKSFSEQLQDELEPLPVVPPEPPKLWDDISTEPLLEHSRE